MGQKFCTIDEDVVKSKLYRKAKSEWSAKRRVENTYLFHGNHVNVVSFLFYYISITLADPVLLALC